MRVRHIVLMLFTEVFFQLEGVLVLLENQRRRSSLSLPRVLNWHCFHTNMLSVKKVNLVVVYYYRDYPDA